MDELERAEARLLDLKRQCALASEAADAVRAQIAANTHQPDPSLPLKESRAVPTTAAEKVRLFRSLFLGRQDVFPIRFVSKKTGRAGYAMACANKFVRDVCELPKVKCGKCPNQAFPPVDDQVVLDHLQGRHVMGVYPLLEDETCWFLAADFDKSSWRADVEALTETCQSIDLPYAVERSRSGNGAHVWFFFSAPVPAATARAMGCYLITKTMARRHQLRMDSYDRLFPNQDTMPRGGFGNLIALPLQYESRANGNTLFLNDAFEPHPDQWSYLASLVRTDPRRVAELAAEAGRKGLVIGVAAVDDEDGESLPWMRKASRSLKSQRVRGPLPAEVSAVLAQRIYVEKVGLPSALLNLIKRLAAFQNPEFYKKQGMRLSTARTPRVITCAEDLDEHVALPRGCLPDLEELLAENDVVLSVDDKRHDGQSLDLEFSGELTPIQKRAARALLEHDIGVFVAPPGIGKTVLGTYIAAQRGRSTLVLVHRRPLLDQWVAQISLFLGLKDRDIGRIGGGKQKANGRMDVAMIQSLVRRDSVEDMVDSYGLVIVDECHHVPAVSFERVLAEVKARYILGLTATPHRRDGHQKILAMQLGPARFTVDPKSSAAEVPFEHRLVVRESKFRLPEALADASIQEIYGALATDPGRNRMILDDVLSALEEGRSPLLLTERRDHLEFLASALGGFVRHLVVLHGGMSAKQRKESARQLAEVPDGEERLVLATGRYIGEGFDSARLDTLFLSMPISWKGTLVQYTGRLHRLHPGKTEVRIVDYVDTHVAVLRRMYERRMRTYRAIGYSREADAAGWTLSSEG